MKKKTLLILLAAAAFSAAFAQKPKSQAEVTALNAMFSAQTLDDRIKAGEDVLTNFANTEFKALVLNTIADSYNRKGDSVKMMVYAERAIEADPKDYQAKIMLAQGIAGKVRENDLDKDEQLKKAEQYANDAISDLNSASKLNPAMTDDQWAAAKKDFTADAHQALGMVAMGRKKYDVAVTEFKSASETAANPDPVALVRLGQAYSRAGKYDEAVATLDKVMNDANAPASIKQFAQAERVRAVQAKGGAAPK